MSNDRTLIDAMLTTAKNIAVVGASDKPARASYNIARYLMNSGYRVFPVNPVLKQVLGRPASATLDEAVAAAQSETGRGIDLVDVFRASEHVPPIVDDLLRLGIQSLWLQDGVTHPAAVAKARAAGVSVVEDDCIFREHAARPELLRK